MYLKSPQKPNNAELVDLIDSITKEIGGNGQNREFRPPPQPIVAEGRNIALTAIAGKMRRTG
jgi:hypothetical protein